MLAVSEWTAVRSVHQAPRCEQNGMARGGIPFACRRRARIDVGLALCEDAKLERRTDGDVVAVADCSLEIVHRRLIEVRLRRDGGHDLSARPGRNCDAPLPFVEPCAIADPPAMESSGGRRKNDSQLRRAILDQADVDRVIVPPTNEFLGSIERVDKE